MYFCFISFGYSNNSKTAQKTEGIQNEIIDSSFSSFSVLLFNDKAKRVGTLMWRPTCCFGWKKFGRSQFFSFICSLFLAFLMLTRGQLVRGPENRNRNHF